MNNNFKLIKEAFSKITTSKELDKKIIDMTINKKSKKKVFYKYVVGSIMILFISFICFGKVSKFYDKKIKKNDKDNYIKDNVLNYDIYMTITNNEELSWAFDVSDTRLIVEKADYVIKVKILDVEKGTYQYSSKNMNPTTPIKVETLQILKGNQETKITQILKWGGLVTIEDVIKNELSTSTNKRELDKLSDEDKKTKYIKYEELANYDFEIGKTYIVALKENKNGNFFMASNGYSVFKENSEKTNYVNVITGNKLEL